MSDTIRTKAELKLLFETGDIPVGQNFADMIESLAVFSAPYNAGNITGPVALNYANGMFQKASLTGATTLAVPSGGTEGSRLELWLTPSGDQTINFNASIKIPTESSIVFPKTLTSGKLYIILLRRNTSNWMLTSIAGGY